MISTCVEITTSSVHVHPHTHAAQPHNVHSQPPIHTGREATHAYMYRVGRVH